jgi:actin-related protein 6
MAAKSVVIDNGGCSIKAGFAGQMLPRRITPNALARGKRDKKIYVGDKILNSPIAEYILTRPSQLGLVLDWECQKLIWENGVFVRDKSGGSFNISSEFESSTVVVTVAPFSPQSVRRETFDVLLNDYRFNRAVLLDSTVAIQFSPGITSQFTPADWKNPCGIIIDCGFSATNIIPVFNTQPIAKASQRLPVAGRILNNLLRERLAYLQIDLDDNPLLIQHIKESVCEVPESDLKQTLSELKSRKPNDVMGYVLPDFSSSNSPYVGSVVHAETEVPPGSQAIKIGADRVAIAETLFNPATFGIDKIGIVEAIILAISLCDECLRGPIASKIIVAGGTCMLPNFLQRLQTELEAALPTVAPTNTVRLLVEADGRFDLSTWRGASQLASNDDDLAFLGAIYRDEWQRP